MTFFESVRKRISLETLVMVAAIVIAPLFGVAIAAATRGQIYPLLGIGALLGVFVMLYIPIEVLLLGGFLGAMLADSRLVSQDLTYYGRFVPMAMLTVRIAFDVILRRAYTLRISRVFTLFGFGFVALATFSAIYSLTPSVTFLRALSMAFVIVSLGIGLPTYLSSYAEQSRMLKLVILLIGSFVLLGTIASQGESDLLFVDESFIRVRGYFANPNTQGLMAMLMFFPVIWWWRTETGSLTRKFISIFVVVWALVVVLAGSRGSLLGVVGGGLVFALLYGRAFARYTPVLIVGLILLAGVLLAFPQYGRAFLIGNTESAAPVAPGGVQQVDRPFLIQRAIELGMRSPIWGVGFGASDLVFEQDHLVLVQQGIFVSGSHNSYTRMFVDLGLVGILAGFPIFVIILARVFLAPGKIRRDPMVALMTAATVTGLVNALFEDWLFGFGSASTLPLWFFLALIPIRMAQLQAEQRAEFESESLSLSSRTAEAAL